MFQFFNERKRPCSKGADAKKSCLIKIQSRRRYGNSPLVRTCVELRHATRTIFAATYLDQRRQVMKRFHKLSVALRLLSQAAHTARSCRSRTALPRLTSKSSFNYVAVFL